jgi:uncharacterized protein YacL
MKSSVLLRNIISLSYYLSCIFWVLVLGFLLFVLFSDSNSVLEIFKNSNEFSVTSIPALISILIFSLLSFAVWIYILQLIRNLMDSLISKSLFTDLQIASFKLIGQLIITLTIVDSISSFVFETIFKNHLEIRFVFFDFWFSISLGLFFVFLSNIFQKAKYYKEENELTV